MAQVGSVLVPVAPPAPDLPAGDPDQLLATARRSMAAAQLLHEVQARLTASTAALGGRRAWCGTASGAFQRSASDTSSWLDNAARALALVAAALLSYAHALADAQRLIRLAQQQIDELAASRARLLNDIEATRATRAGLAFGAELFEPGTVALQRRADALATQLRVVEASTESGVTLARRAEQTAAAAFDEAAAMTRAARERLALEQAERAAGGEPASPWLLAGELIGFGLTDLVLGAADAAQAGLDPITDAAELASLARTKAVASRLLGRAAEEEAAATLEAGALQAAERQALTDLEREAETDWLAGARAKLPDAWGPGEPARGVGTRWQEPEGRGSYLRIDKGRPEHGDPLQQIDHVHIRKDGTKIGRDGEPLPRRVPGVEPPNLQELIDLEHVPLEDWLTWRDWWRP